MRKLVLIAFLCFLVPLARADTYISGCSVLNIPGETYYLTADIIDSTASVCMDITANNVVLDCQGHTIDGVYTRDTLGINVYRESDESTKVTIKNCVVSGWWYGIGLERANNNSIINSIVSGNDIYGIYLRYSSNNTIINSTANNNYYGIYLRYSSNNSIINFTANGNFWGIWLWFSSNNNTITNSTANSNIYAGIYLEWSYNNQITNSTANYNIDDIGSGGILIFESSNNSIINFTANSNSRGIYLYSSSNNSITNSTANSNIYAGIYLWLSSNNQITNSIVSGNGNGIWLDESYYNLFYNNLFNNTNNFYFYTIQPNYWNTTRQPGQRIYSPGTEIGGNYWTNTAGTGYSDTCADADKDGFCDEPYMLAEDNVDYLPLSDEYVVCECTPWQAGDCVNSTHRTYTRACTPSNCDVEVKHEADTACTTYPWLDLLNVILSPFWIIMLIIFAVSATIEKKLGSNGLAFAVSFVILSFIFSVFVKEIPLWIPVIALILIIGFIILRGRT